ncbi:DUF4344 domain-containing metallopeptidase [Emticicia sp. BO119]|uniref:DUF4344 domain-containing metallopeptidase n=1 Tax=Emticicia sp. BO119 TaxID=2757768 RepID=UPI0015F026CE|nr:DUF4344 domain-containing metallopeptidase [Emticicia sp. BO119]MBA4849109.1 hypothetical protein [Emticicia sp. BO119]
MKFLIVSFISCLSLTVFSQQAKTNDYGDVKVVWNDHIKDSVFSDFQEGIKRTKILDAIANDINGYLALPEDLYITFDECQSSNAFYDEHTKKVTICYEMVSYLYELFKTKTNNPAQLREMVINTTLFIFYHEMGHALIDLMDLPVTGKEEDTVDNFSIFLLADGSKKGSLAVLDGAIAFYLMGESEKNIPLKNLELWDEHSLDHQRFYHIICMLYGSNPIQNQALIREKMLPLSMTNRCIEDYQKIKKGWLKVLEQWIKK